MVALVAALALAGPPKATLQSGTSVVKLAISSWCWRGRCGAPIAASRKAAVAARGSLVTVELAFVPRRAHVAVAGRAVAARIRGDSVSWAAARGGGVTITVTNARGWVTYVGRLRLR